MADEEEAVVAVAPAAGHARPVLEVAARVPFGVEMLAPLANYLGVQLLSVANIMHVGHPKQAVGNLVNGSGANKAERYPAVALELLQDADHV